MIVYISGPMSGLPDNNSPAFDAAAARLRAEGYEVVSPAELSRGIDRARRITGRKPACWHNYMAQAIVAMQTVDAILQLPGWENSPGARIEAIVAFEKMHLIPINEMGQTLWKCDKCGRHYSDPQDMAYIGPADNSDQSCEAHTPWQNICRECGA